MKIRGVEDILREHPAFRDFDDDIIGVLAGCARNEQFQAGQLIYREGDPSDRVFLLRRGDVAIEVSAPGRPPIIIETLHAGDMTGWGWMVPPYEAMSDARALTPVSAISLDSGCMRRKCDEDAAVGYAMFKHWLPQVARRVRALRLQLLDLYGAAPPAARAE